MKTLSREEMISIISGNGGADRVPMIYDMWVDAGRFGEYAPIVQSFLNTFPADVQRIGLQVPDIYVAPADEPSYRWLAKDKVPDETNKALDAQTPIESWDELDEILADFPNGDYAKLWQLDVEETGQYRLFHWWFWLFERHWSLRGMENALTDYYLYPEETHRLYDKITEFYCQLTVNAKKHYNADGIFISDDIGTQKGTFFSKAIFDEFFKPYYKRVIDCAHSLDMHVWLHCCGDIELFLPGFVEIGLDVLHPIQKYTMKEKNIAEKFGDKICIFAGFDVQQTIPYGTPEDVKKELRFLIDTYARKDGRLILTMGNAVTPDCPPESLFALMNESYTYGKEKMAQLR